MLRKLLYRWAGRLPGRIIMAETSDDDQRQTPLFERYYVGTVLGWTIYLHHYLRPDPDRGLHDHPWSRAIALPLAGGYTEHRLHGFAIGGRVIQAHRRAPFRPYVLRGEDFHRIAAFRGAALSSWSLFAHRPNSKGWGFLRPTEKLGAVIFVPHLEVNGSHTKWWLSARIGAALNRAAP